MKILLVNKFHYVKGGSETYYFGLGELLKKRGHEVVYFSMQDEKNRPCPEAKYFVDNVDFNADVGVVKKLKAAVKMLYSHEAKKKFEALVLAEKPDVVHLNIFQSQLTGSIVDVAKKHKIPMVYTAHDLKSVCPNYQMLNHGEVCERCLHGNYGNCFKTGCMKNSKLKSLLATLEAYGYKRRKTYRKFDYIITPSAFYKKKIDEAGIARCPVVHLPNFLPEDAVYAPSETVGDYLLYFGRLSNEKGILTLVKAYAAAGVTMPLHIVGTGPKQEEIEALIAELGLGEKVKLLGFKQGKELKDVVANSRAVCLPSEWYENGPYSIMEAMAAGKSAIVSTLGGLPEMVEDGVTGFVVPAKDEEKLGAALQKVATMPEDLLKKMGVAAVERAKRLFDAQAYCDKLEEIYRAVVARNGGAGL